MIWKGFNLNSILIEGGPCPILDFYLYIAALIFGPWWFMTGRGINESASNAPKMALPHPPQPTYSIATQCGRDKWQPLGRKASSCTLAWASHLAIMPGHSSGENETDSGRLWSPARVSKKIIIFLLRSNIMLSDPGLFTWGLVLYFPYCTDTQQI